MDIYDPGIDQQVNIQLNNYTVTLYMDIYYQIQRRQEASSDEKEIVTKQKTS